MMVIRPIATSDHEALIAMAFSAEFVLPSIPKDRQLLQKRIEYSLRSFSSAHTNKQSAFYLFVLENLDDGTLHGTCGIKTSDPIQDFSYFYRLQQERHQSKQLQIDHYLTIVNAHKQTELPAELCALFLSPKVRREGLGKLLSLSRLLFIAAQPKRFPSELMALLRGIVDSEGRSPFWEAIGRHFCHHEMTEMERLYTSDKDVMTNLLPRYPIYLSLLPKEAQEAIGKPHHHTEAAYNMLHQQGFVFSGDVDIFDGGPKISSKISELSAISRNNRSFVYSVNDEAPLANTYIIANEHEAFRACYGAISFSDDGKAILHSNICKALNISAGDPFRYIKVEI